MKLKKLYQTLAGTALFALGIGAFEISAPRAFAGGGSTVAKPDSIKVVKNFYAAANKTLLINASSSNGSAVLTAYLPSGRLLGRLQNGNFNRYGGTVFWVGADPSAITIKSTGGAEVVVPTSPYKP